MRYTVAGPSAAGLVMQEAPRLRPGLQWLHTSVTELKSATITQLQSVALALPLDERPKLVLATVRHFTK
jgi:hypothetical protein